MSLEERCLMSSGGQSENIGRLNALLERHGVAVVTGEIGLGATQLLTELEDRPGQRTVSIPYHRAEATIGCSGLEIVVAGLKALDAAAFDVDFTRSDRTELDLAEDILHAVHTAEIAEGTVLVIPRADAMDATSQSALGHILRRLSDARLRVVISTREITEESPFSGIPRLELRPMTRRDLMALALRSAQGGLSEESAALAARAAAGRPHALQLIIDDMAPSHREGQFALPVPLTIGAEAAAMARKILGDVDAAVEPVLKMLSVAPLTSIGPMRREMPEVGELISELESRGVIARRGPYVYIAEELVRATVHWSMGSKERSALHARLSEYCSGASSQMEHWHRSYAHVDEETASVLARDGLSLITCDLLDAGIDFVERALSLSSTTNALAELLVDIAEALLTRGNFVFAARYIRFAMEAAEPAIAVRARTLGVRLTFIRSQALPTRLINNWSRAELSAAPREVATLLLNLSLLHGQRRELAEAQELLTVAEGLRVHFSDEALLLADAARMAVEAERGNDAFGLEQFTALSDHDVEGLAPEYLLSLASSLMMTEHYASAQASLHVLREVAPVKAVLWWVQAQYVEAEIAIRAGNIGHALGLIESFPAGGEARAEIRRDRQLVLQTWRLLMLGRASDAEAKEAELAAYAAKTRHSGLFAELSGLQGSYLLRAGLVSEAVRHLHRCDERSAGAINPNRYRHEPELIVALIQLGRREHAALLLQQLKSKAQRCPSRWAQGAIRLCEAMIASGNASLELFQAALRASRNELSLFEKAHIHAAFAQRLTELSAGPRARDHELIAASLYEEVGATFYSPTAALPAAEQVPVEPEPPVVTIPALNDLSEDERLVVEMVRSGMKNRDIAGRIFISVRTVELRLTAVYKKLGVSSRTELVARLSGAPQLVSP